MINLKIVTPKKLILEIKCLHVKIPSKIGELQIHKGHTPLLAKLINGILSFKNPKNYTKRIVVEDGFIIINEKSIIILTEEVTKKNEINLQIEKKLINQLKNELNNTKNEKNIKKIQLQINKSTIKCKLAEQS